MEFSVPGFIKRYCTPNAILTLTEYLVDYATEEVATKGWALINKEINQLEDAKLKKEVSEKVDRIKNGERDLYF